jgi:hypothetical protein
MGNMGKYWNNGDGIFRLIFGFFYPKNMVDAAIVAQWLIERLTFERGGPGSNHG